MYGYVESSDLDSCALLRVYKLFGLPSRLDLAILTDYGFAVLYSAGLITFMHNMHLWSGLKVSKITLCIRQE